MYVHRSGYHPPNETLATHCRRRYRLTASKSPQPNVSIDPSLWLVHYAACEDGARLPANRIAVLPQTQQIMSTRRYLQTQGQLVRKEFMLHDRATWPAISFPGGPVPVAYPQQPGGVFATPPHQPGRPGPQQNPYFAQQQQQQLQQQQLQQQQQHQHAQAGMGPSPAKRARQNPPAHAAPAPPAIPHDAYFDEDEDTSRGDMLDHLTPREIAMMRYRQHHEWMEEILSSPYAISQIVPVDLGLELKGGLEGITKGIFESPAGDGTGNATGPRRVGKLAPGKLEELQKRVAAYEAATKAETEESEAQHRRRMAKLEEKAKRFRDWELRLRDAETDPTDTGTEVWRLEGRIEDPEDGDDDEAPVSRKPRECVDDVVREVEAALKKKVVDVPEVVCADPGGLQDNPTQAGGAPQAFVRPEPRRTGGR